MIKVSSSYCFCFFFILGLSWAIWAMKVSLHYLSFTLFILTYLALKKIFVFSGHDVSAYCEAAVTFAYSWNFPFASISQCVCACVCSCMLRWGGGHILRNTGINITLLDLYLSICVICTLLQCFHSWLLLVENVLGLGLGQTMQDSIRTLVARKWHSRLFLIPS